MSAEREAEAFLLEAHSRDPGGSPRIFEKYRSPAGKHSYQHLLDALDGAGDGPVLDLGCGDGPLLQALGPRPCLGVDMSPHELDQARRRLGSGVRLLRGRLQELPLASGSMAAAVSHMVFMLLRPVEPALAEVARVLRPGGVFAFVVGASRERCPADQAFLEELRRTHDQGGRKIPPLGDPRMRRDEDIPELLRGAGLEPGDVRPLHMARRACPEELWPDVEGFYDVGGLLAEDREELRGRVTARFRELADERGETEMRFRMLLVTARA